MKQVILGLTIIVFVLTLYKHFARESYNDASEAARRARMAGVQQTK